MNNKEWLLGKTLVELEKITIENGFPMFVSKQIADWLYKKRVSDISMMKNIGKAKIEKLSEKYIVGEIPYSSVATSFDGTKKYLFKTISSTNIETAYIPDRERATLCVSSQIGCRMGCEFCMTARGGYHGNLSAGEIINQIFRIDDSEKLTNIVYMGMGEPLDNKTEVFKSLEIITSEWGLGWSPTRITLSSIGVIPSLKQFLDESKVHLAISLHNPISEERRKIMPIENKYPIGRVIELLKEYDFSHQRRVSFEYIMFDGLNDTKTHLHALINMLKGVDCRINLIRFHRIPDSLLVPSSESKITEFRDALTSRGIMTTIRASRGEDIYAACGMLSNKSSNV